MSYNVTFDPFGSETTKTYFRIQWDSPANTTWWPGETLKWSVRNSNFEHVAICDMPKGAQTVYRQALADGTNVKVLRWTVVTIASKAEEVDGEALAES